MRSSKYLSGSFTIELSLIMPLIISVIITILFLGYFIHDKCLLECEAYLTAINVSDEISRMNNSENSQVGIPLFESVYVDVADIKRRLIGAWDISEAVTYNDSVVEVSINGKMNCFDAFGLHIISSNLFGVAISESVPCMCEKYYLRR